nr:MAG TPA: hypothetical protein [Caudoviricetes sp.]
MSHVLFSETLLRHLIFHETILRHLNNITKVYPLSRTL